MTFKDIFERYQAGMATEDEIQMIEEELEKRRLIDEYLDDEWNDTPIMEMPAQDEMKKVRKHLRRRNASMLLVCMVLVIALLAGTFYILIPSLESKYWNPDIDSYECEYNTDLELTLAAYSELFIPGQGIMNVASTRTEFATYDLIIQYWNIDSGENHYSYGTLKKNELTIPQELMSVCPMNIFENACFPAYPLDDDVKQRTYEKLAALPDYVEVEAAVSFAEDMNMEELLAFDEENEGAGIIWIGIRSCPEDVQRAPLVGMAPFAGGVIREGINDDYPYFEIKGEERSAENLEAHFKSLLQFMKDQEAKEKGVGYPNGSDYYDFVLDYVENNGVESYGCYMKASPEFYLELLDSGIASQVWTLEGRIDI